MYVKLIVVQSFNAFAQLCLFVKMFKNLLLLVGAITLFDQSPILPSEAKPHAYLDGLLHVTSTKLHSRKPYDKIETCIICSRVMAVLDHMPRHVLRLNTTYYCFTSTTMQKNFA